MVIDLRQRKPEWLDQRPDWELAALAHLQKCYPQEGCGIFVATGFIPMLNRHPEPCTAFEMDPDVFINHEVLGVIHSHPDGYNYPSKADMQAQIACAVPWALAVTRATGTDDPVWWGDELPVAPLVGRPFRYGVFDCYSLIRDWYRIKREVTLKDFPRDWDFWSAGEPMYDNHFAEAGFVEIDPAVVPLEEGDVFLAKLRAEVANHGGVYVGGGQVMHHVQNSLSRRSQFELWSDRITKWLRYQG